MQGFPFVHRETVRWRDLDVWGHVNNAVYSTYLEQARIAYLRHLGLLASHDVEMILARVEIDFRAQLEAGEEVEIGVRPGRIGAKSFALEHELHAGGRLVAEASTVLVSYDYAARTTKAVPEAWRDALEREAVAV